MRKYKKKIIYVSIFISILLLVLFPCITNKIMNTTPPFFITVAENNDWIGFFSCYFGAIFGGLISGFFTYIGVKLTIKDQAASREEQLKISNRPHISISEVFDASFNLQNVSRSIRNGRLIITPEYRLAIERNMQDANYNFIKIDNNGSGTAINCEIIIGVTFAQNNESRVINLFLSTIDTEERVFIPIDPIPDRRQYRITNAEVKYETMMKEEMMVRRTYNIINGEYTISDSYYIKDINDEDYKELFKIRGSSAEWMFIDGN